MILLCSICDFSIDIYTIIISLNANHIQNIICIMIDNTFIYILYLYNLQLTYYQLCETFRTLSLPKKVISEKGIHYYIINSFLIKAFLNSTRTRKEKILFLKYFINKWHIHIFIKITRLKFKTIAHIIIIYNVVLKIKHDYVLKSLNLIKPVTWLKFKIP